MTFVDGLMAFGAIFGAAVAAAGLAYAYGKRIGGKEVARQWETAANHWKETSQHWEVTTRQPEDKATKQQ